MSTLPETCDFCDLPIEEDEELEPLHVGTPPDPKPIFAKATGPRGGYSASREAGKLSVLRKALHGCEYVDLKESDVVHEVTAVGGETHFVTDDDMMNVQPTEFETHRKSGKVGAEVVIRPEAPNATPDAMVCEVCAEMFRTLAD